MTIDHASGKIGIGTKLPFFVIQFILNWFANKKAIKEMEGLLKIEFPTGRMIELGNGETGRLKPALVYIRNFRGLVNLIARGPLGFAEGYINGDIDTPDLEPVFHFSLNNRETVKSAFPQIGHRYFVSKLFHKFHRNSKSGSRKNIESHYDLGNNFYECWLDESMTYSSSYFESDSESLFDAQQNKYRKIGEHISLENANSILEIGCGWGGFAEFAAQSADAKVTAISISNAQIEYARQRIAKKNLEENVEIKFLDYRDTKGKFDAIVSIEMIEAVGEEYWPVFFKTLKERLGAGGTILLQAITIDESVYSAYRRSVDYIQRHIFPGGMLMTKQQIESQSKKAGLKLVHSETFPQYYAKTLGIWYERFNEAWDSIRAQGFDEKFRRKWNYYLKYCQAGFEDGTISVGHYKIQHGN